MGLYDLFNYGAFMTYGEVLGQEKRQKLLDAIQEVFDIEAGGCGMVIVFRQKKDGNSKISDCYAGLCRDCAAYILNETLIDADKQGLFVKHDKND